MHPERHATLFELTAEMVDVTSAPIGTGAATGTLGLHIFPPRSTVNRDKPTISPPGGSAYRLKRSKLDELLAKPSLP
jgi:hypothetical protein